MKKILIGLGVVIVLLVLAVLIVPALIPVDTYKAQIVSRLEAATGRTVRIDGPMTLSVLPVLGVSAEKVSLANAPGRTPAQMVTLDKLDVRIAVFPLLRGQLVVDAFVLEKPVIALSVDKAGTPNWQFAAKAAAPAAPVPGARNPPPAASPGGGSAPISGLSLSDVRIVDGQATYADARTGASYQADAINMTVSLPSLTSPMQASGSLVWNQQKISLTLNLADPNALLTGTSTAIDAKLSGDPLTLAFKGQMSSGKAVAARGDLDLDVPSVRKLAAWAGKPLTAPGSGFGPLKISGTVDVAGAKAAFTKATLSLDAIKGSGDFRYDGTGAKPDVNARLALGTLDLNPYLPPQSGGGGTGAPAAPSGPAHPPAAPASAPAGATPSHEWSDVPIDFSPLRAADADLDLAVDGLIYRKIKIGKSHLTVALKGGRLVADLTDMALYQGNGKAKVTADDSQATPAVGLDFDLAGVQANPLLSDAMDLTRLEGTANGAVSVTGHGASQRAIVSSLDGSGKVQFLNGAIRGIDIPAMVRNVTSAFTGAQGGPQKTDFSEMGGTFTIKNGILTNNDMAMQSPLLRVSGKGTVDIPKQTVDYRVEPKMVASLQGQGGQGNLGGIAVPVVVQGPWDNLSYKPDLSGMVKSLTTNPPKSLNDLKNMFKGGGSAPGQASGSGSGSGSTAPAQNPLGALKGLLGK
jgi:AsmA protein